MYTRDEDIVGFVSLHIQELLHHAERIGEIQELIVSEKERGIGIGKKLFEKTKEVCQQEGAVQLEVCCNQM